MNIKRPIAFILASTNHGTMITNKNDFHSTKNGTYGVGYQLLTTSSFDSEEVQVAKALIAKRKKNFGDGVLAIDCGANIGVHTLEWAKFMYGWGSVLSFEAQEKIFYALAGNIAINNCLNVQAENVAIGAKNGTIEVPIPNYHKPSSYGSLEITQKTSNEFIGQDINFSNTKTTRMISLDSLEIDRVDFIKIDVEGMEQDVLNGACKLIENTQPIMLIEHIKSNKDFLQKFLKDFDYKFFAVGINIIAVHESDPTLSDIEIKEETFTIRG